jgi:hypothetical protein
MQIRRRRLEKLSGSGSSTPKTGPDGNSSSLDPKDTSSLPAEQTESSTKPGINITKSSTPSAASQENPFSKLTNRSPSGSNTPSVRSQSATSSLKRHAEADVQTTPRPAPRKAPQASNEETIEVYENSKPVLDLFYICRIWYRGRSERVARPVGGASAVLPGGVRITSILERIDYP